MVINNTGTRMLKDDDAQIVGSWTIVAPFTKAFKPFRDFCARLVDRA